MIGLLIGIPGGLVMFFLLKRFAGGLCSGGNPPLGYGLLFVLFPMILLTVTALWRHDILLWTGSGMAAALVVPGFINFMVQANQKKLKPSQTPPDEERTDS